MKDFVHLHVHTDYSLLRSCNKVKTLAKSVAEMGMKACAITDYGNMYGVISFYSAMKENGVKPIIGYEAHLQVKGTVVEEENCFDIVLLAKDLKGYSSLVWLASKAFTEGLHKEKPRISLDMLSSKREGLIALTSGRNGFIYTLLNKGMVEEAERMLSALLDIFGKENLYLEIQDHKTELEEKVNKYLPGLAKKFNIKLVATNDVHYLRKEDAEAREVLECIAKGETFDPANKELKTSEYYLKSPLEMIELFKELPEAIESTTEIAEKCELDIPSQLQLPLYPIPSCYESLEEYFEHVVFEGYRMRNIPKEREAEYLERLKFEIETIKKMGYAGYFLIVWDFVRFAKERGIPVGPGRGSAAGSLVSYCLEITDIDPIRYNLLFERFLNPERVSMPDIDIDFCVRGRSEVIKYVAEKYGEECVCQIITFGTLASRAAVRDVGRALGLKTAEIEKIAKLIPPPFRGRNTTIEKALEMVPELRQMVEKNEKTRKVIEIARQLEGCARHSSIHAAGVIISPKPLYELIPVAIKEEKGRRELVSQYAMGDLEKIGMLKMDFLALTTLTIIDDTVKLVEEKTGYKIDWQDVRLDDEKVMQIFTDGRTEAVFQFESEGMKEICRKLKPRNIEDLAALNALYRPGPLDGGMVDDFIERHHGKKSIEYIDPRMQEILGNTYGVLVYQEQIMQLAQQLAGYTLGEADMMRRAMGKKKKEEMDHHRERFIRGAEQRGIPYEKAKQIFELMYQFADYGFNRSHSVAYAYLAFQTAYLKAYYPTFFYAAVLSHESQNTDKIYKYSLEMQSFGLKLLPPDVNESDTDFTPSQKAIRFGLSAIKGLGRATAETIISARKTGKFLSFSDFLSRVDPSVLNRRSLESLVCAGAFDSLRPQNTSLNSWRAQLFSKIDRPLLAARDSLQKGLFLADDSFEFSTEDKPWSDKELAEKERQALGFYLSFHPLSSYNEEIKKLGVRRIADLDNEKPNTKVVVVGVINSPQVKYSKKGDRFCVFRLDDMSSSAKCKAWSEAYQRNAKLFEEGQAVIVEGRLDVSDSGDLSIIVDKLEQLEEKIANSIVIETDVEGIDKLIESLIEEINPHGKYTVDLKVKFEHGISATFRVGFLVSSLNTLKRKIEKIGYKVELLYDGKDSFRKSSAS